MMLTDDRILMGVTGTAVSAVGAGMSVTEVQAIVSIVITVIGFVISVLVPTIVKIANKIKKAKEDGVVTEEEKKEIKEEIEAGSKKVIEEGKKALDEINNKDKE